MATIDEFNLAKDAWCQLNDVVEDAKTTNFFKSEEIVIFQQSSNDMKFYLEEIESYFWKVDSEKLEKFIDTVFDVANKIDELTEMGKIFMSPKDV